MPTTRTPEDALFASSWGSFSPDGEEYRITRWDTPRPWCHVLCNGEYGCIVSHAGGGFSWRGNSQLKMINRWDQDLIRDAMGRFLYLRDGSTNEVWSADRRPTLREPDAFQARYGLGYAITDLTAHGIRCEKTVFVPNDAPCEIWRVRLTNLGDAPRQIALFTYLEWQLGAVSEWHREFHKTFMETEWRAAESAIYAWKKGDIEHADEPFGAFHAVLSQPADGYDADKESFLGREGSTAAPRGPLGGRLAGRTGRWNDPIAALHVETEVRPGAAAEVDFLIGAGTRDDLAAAHARFREPGAVDAALADVRAMWRGFTGASNVETPDPALNLMTNAWLKYQAIAGRLWARTGYYQNSGAFGFRDQLQDSQVWLPIEPERTIEQIRLHAAHQFADGTVQHWWHPGSDIASVSNCTDDLLWLAYIAMNAIEETGDAGLWDMRAPFLPGPDGAAGEGTLYEHCVRAFDKVFTRFSPRGLPLIGECDWNDGLSHLGREWRGESTWLAHFLVGLLRRFAEYADERGDHARVRDYCVRANALTAAINAHCWDGGWYWRATKDNGETIGSHTCAENQIDLIAQAWAVINGTAPPDRAETCMDAAQERLFREYGPLLLTPAYSKTDPDIGYITRYAPGLRENGGVYSHAACWGIQALCMLGRGDAAWKAYASMSPPRRGTDPALYYAEPYVMPGNIDGPDSPTFGRGGWTWYTGSAAWMQRIATEWICGIRPTRAGLLIDPCIPSTWPSFKATRRFRGATYEIEVQNPHASQHGVKSVTLDGQPLPGNLIPPDPCGGLHQVCVEMV
jgi:cellobiose phosphorylase